MDTRVSPDQTQIRRRRKCPHCGYKFSTLEMYCKNELIVVKRDGREEDFDSEKIFRGLKKAIKSDEKAAHKIKIVLEAILKEIQEQNSSRISSEMIGTITMKELKIVDPIAYLRFASIYKNFHETSEFEQEFKNLET